jgi:uncharacterized protein YqhQ
MNKTFTMIRDYIKENKILSLLFGVIVALDSATLVTALTNSTFDSLSIDAGFTALIIFLFLLSYLFGIRKTEKVIKMLHDYLADNDADILVKNAEPLKLSLFSKDLFWIGAPLYGIVSLVNIIIPIPTILIVTYIMSSLLFVVVMISSGMTVRYANRFIDSMSEDLLRKALHQISSGGDDE